jgi:hypothetical protein
MRPTFRIVLLGVLIAGLPAIARAASGALAGIDGMTSTVMQEHQSSFSGLAVRVRLRSARIVSGFELLPSVEYWRNSTTVDPFGIKTSRRDGTLAVDTRYTFSKTPFHPYLGGGLGLHFLSSSATVPGIGYRSTSVVKGGLAALGGISFGMTPKLDNFLELKYHHLPGYSQLKINWGLSWSL